MDWEKEQPSPRKNTFEKETCWDPWTKVEINAW